MPTFLGSVAQCFMSLFHVGLDPTYISLTRTTCLCTDMAQLATAAQIPGRRHCGSAAIPNPSSLRSGRSAGPSSKRHGRRRFELRGVSETCRTLGRLQQKGFGTEVRGMRSGPGVCIVGRGLRRVMAAQRGWLQVLAVVSHLHSGLSGEPNRVTSPLQNPQPPTVPKLRIFRASA